MPVSTHIHKRVYSDAHIYILYKYFIEKEKRLYLENHKEYL